MIQAWPQLRAIDDLAFIIWHNYRSLFVYRQQYLRSELFLISRCLARCSTVAYKTAGRKWCGAPLKVIFFIGGGRGSLLNSVANCYKCSTVLWSFRRRWCCCYYLPTIVINSRCLCLRILSLELRAACPIVHDAGVWPRGQAGRLGGWGGAGEFRACLCNGRKRGAKEE